MPMPRNFRGGRVIAISCSLAATRGLVEANHTIAIPAGVPHAFVALGPTPVRMFTFMPRNRAIAEGTTYFEGAPPPGAGQH